MNSKLLSVLVFLTLICMVGCGQQSKNLEGTTESYTEDQLNTLITNGMSTTDVTNLFGPPAFVIPDSGHGLYLHYSFRHAVKETDGAYLAGFGIDTKDDRVVRWSPGEFTLGKPLPSGPIYRAGNASFKLFVRDSGSVSNLLMTIAAQGSADASELSGTPDMTFEAETDVEQIPNQPPGQQTVLLTISKQDAAKLESLTSTNTGKRVLVICRDKILAAPVIYEPIGETHLRVVTTATNFLQSPRGQ